VIVGPYSEDIRFLVLECVDGPVGCFVSERLESLGEVVGCQPVSNVASEFVDRRVMERVDGRFLDGSDHAFGLGVQNRGAVQ
jgi:hypothetical protein